MMCSISSFMLLHIVCAEGPSQPMNLIWSRLTPGEFINVLQFYFNNSCLSPASVSSVKENRSNCAWRKQSSARYKHHVLYFHVNTNKHYSSFSQSHHALCYTSEHLPHNPDELTSSHIIIIISSHRGTLVLHFIQSWPELCFSRLF